MAVAARKKGFIFESLTENQQEAWKNANIFTNSSNTAGMEYEC